MKIVLGCVVFILVMAIIIIPTVLVLRKEGNLTTTTVVDETTIISSIISTSTSTFNSTEITSTTSMTTSTIITTVTTSTSTTTVITTMTTTTIITTVTTSASTTTVITTMTTTTVTTTMTTTTIITTVTTSTSTSTTTAATPPPYFVYNQCTTSINNLTILMYLTNVYSTAYTYYSFLYTTPPGTTKTTIVFSFLHRPTWWFLDNIQVYDLVTFNTVNTDGSFEANNLYASYTVCTLPDSNPSTGGELSPYGCRVGFYCYLDSTMTEPDYLIQSFNTVPERAHTISYWISQYGGTPNMAIFMVGH